MSTQAHDVDTGTETTETDKVNTAALGTLTIVGLLAMISITAAITALVRHDLDVEDSEKAVSENRIVSELKAAQGGLLTAPAGYVDRAKGLVSLPIGIAKGLVLSELSRDPNSATPAPPVQAASGGAVTAAAVDSSAAPATLKPKAATGESSKASSLKPETGRAVLKLTPTTANEMSSPPTATPKAAVPGSQEPGPTNK